jgi:hypothetical protein
MNSVELVELVKLKELREYLTIPEIIKVSKLSKLLNIKLKGYIASNFVVTSSSLLYSENAKNEEKSIESFESNANDYLRDNCSSISCFSIIDTDNINELNLNWGSLTHLKSISLIGIQIKSQALNKLISNSSNLTSLELNVNIKYNTREASDLAPIPIPANLIKLNIEEISWNSNFNQSYFQWTAELFELIFGKLANLPKLRIFSCYDTCHQELNLLNHFLNLSPNLKQLTCEGELVNTSTLDILNTHNSLKGIEIFHSYKNSNWNESIYNSKYNLKLADNWDKLDNNAKTAYLACATSSTINELTITNFDVSSLDLQFILDYSPQLNRLTIVNNINRTNMNEYSFSNNTINYFEIFCTLDFYLDLDCLTNWTKLTRISIKYNTGENESNPNRVKLINMNNNWKVIKYEKSYELWKLP